jgi:HAD superfamily hydrolase (TIGR01509 family)
MTYKAVGFDYGGVIKGKPSGYFMGSLCSILGITPEQYKKSYYKFNKQVNRDEITWHELWALVVKDLGKGQLLPEVIKFADEGFKQSLNEDVLELVDKVKKKGYRVGLLSNNTADLRQEVQELGVDKHFDVVNISGETGLVKPEVAAFKYFANDLGVGINEFIFIDDSPQSLSTADECGYTPILFESTKGLVAELIRLKVLV